jgi:5-methylcytosine-specific restriction endonuclease McrA
MSKYLRSLTHEKQKHPDQLIKESGITCNVAGCNNSLTHKKGVGSNCLCFEHQANLKEYGGTGQLSELHTIHRKWVCVQCGFDAQKHVRTLYPTLEHDNPVLFNRCCRTLVDGDHIIDYATSKDDSEKNSQTLCKSCHAIKTILSEDNLAPAYRNRNDEDDF